MPVPALAGVASSHRLSGLEFGVAIPASLGGSVRMNAGAHGHAIDEVVLEIQTFSIGVGRPIAIAASEAGFSYRRSELPADSVVTGATLQLQAGEPEQIRTLMTEAREWRRATQPLAEPNCGSVFKNPPDGHAAQLIEESGAKGLAVGGAAVSEKHANFIVASPGATAADVTELIRVVQERVRSAFGVELEREVHLVGDFEPASQT